MTWRPRRHCSKPPLHPAGQQGPQGVHSSMRVTPLRGDQGGGLLQHSPSASRNGRSRDAEELPMHWAGQEGLGGWGDAPGRVARVEGPNGRSRWKDNACRCSAALQLAALRARPWHWLTLQMGNAPAY